MSLQANKSAARIGLALGLYVAAAAVGLVLGYDFGTRAGGLWLGIVAALNGAVFCTILVDALIPSAKSSNPSSHQAR